MNKAMFVMLLSVFLSAACVANDLVSGLITKSSEDASVYFISPKDGQVVKGAFNVQFGLSGMGVAPAGSNVNNTGHHHLLINKDISELDLTKSLPSTGQIKHFGGGQTETVLNLPKGKYTLQLLLGNFAHIPHDKPVHSKKITITVK